MFNSVEQKVSEEKIDWQERVKVEFPFDWPFALAVIRTADAILENKHPGQNINWEKVYKACNALDNEVFSSLYNSEQTEKVNQCYQQFIQGKRQALEKIYYFNNQKRFFSYNVLNNNLTSTYCQLTALDLSNGLFVGELAEALKSANCKLSSLNLKYCQVRDDGVRKLTQALRHGNCKLTSLNLDGNKIGEFGVIMLADILQNDNCKLTSLSLSYNRIGIVGAKDLAEALQSRNCKLTALALRGNQIGDAGTKEFVEVLKYGNCKLTSLNLRYNHIGDAGAKELVEALKNGNCNLISLNLKSNQISEAGALAVALALKSSHCSCGLYIELDENIKPYISRFNEEWHRAQALYILLAHPDGSSQHLSVLPPYVIVKVLFPYLFDIFKDEPYSQIGNCFIENHKRHFEMMRMQASLEVKYSRQEAETHMVYKM